MLRKFKSKSRATKEQTSPPRHQNLAAGRVTALEPQVKRPNRFNLYIDDHFALGLSLYVAAGVRVGQELSQKELEALARAEHQEDAHERALRFLEQRPRSEQELRRNLKGKGFEPDVIDHVVARLHEVKLLGDKTFARYWVENREGFKPRSARALKYELRQKGVSNEDIARAVSKVDERDSAYRAARPKALRYTSLDERAFREKVGGFLARRGFDYGITRETVQRLWQELKGTTNSNREWEMD